MYRRFHDRFGTVGVVIAVIALIAALGGTAIAAAGLTGKQKKEVTKIAKKYAGKPGAPGAAGTNGTNGKDGAPGAQGEPGADGADGKSVELIEGAGSCSEGGTTVQVEGEPSSSQEVCNGEAGEEGEPWTNLGKLPANATETGAWNITLNEFGYGDVSLSFAVPRATALDNAHVIFVEAPNANCDNGQAPAPSVANPEADSGYLCVFPQASGFFAFILNPAQEFGTEGAATTGALLRAGKFSEFSPGDVLTGTWAVTG